MGFLEMLMPQGRALVVILPAVTLMAHMATFILLEAAFAGTWRSSWCASYDLIAAFASAIGLLGAIQRRRILVAMFLVVHTVTLTLISSLLLVHVLPRKLASAVPVFSRLRYDGTLATSVCEGLEVGIGWEGRWLESCVSSFGVLARSAVWASVVMMVAQWLVAISVWNWLRAVKGERNNSTHDNVDLEKNSHVEKISDLDIRQEYRG